MTSVVQSKSPSQISNIGQATVTMTITADASENDWKQRCEELQYQHQLDLERIRLHYDHELKEKVNEIRTQLKREYDHQFTEFRDRLLEQQKQLLHNSISPRINLDQSLGEQVREQIRLSELLDRRDEEQRQQLLSQHNIDSDELKRLVNKLHTEGVHVLTLSERLSLHLNGIKIDQHDESESSYEKLQEENHLLRSLIAKINANETSSKLIRCLAEIFQCEQERRLKQVREEKNLNYLEEEIQHMCDYQRDALGKLLSQDRLLLIEELDQTKRELEFLKSQLEKFKNEQFDSPSVNSQHLNKFYTKYLRCEAYRKALIYQKRYLLVLLTGYQDTETYALNEIRRLTGDTRSKSTFYVRPFDQGMKMMPQHSYHRRRIDYQFRFRCYVRVVIAMVRMRWLAKKWANKIASIR